MADQTLGATQQPAWGSISDRQRRLVLLMAVSAIVEFILVDIYFRYQQLSQIKQYLSGSATSSLPGDGVLFTPLVLSFLVYAILVAAVVVLVNSKAKTKSELGLVLLGGAWLLASIPLAFDFLIDSFEPKLVLAVLFVYAGIRYWKGDRNNAFAFVLAPLLTLIAAGDGLGHLSGSFCGPTGLDSCSAKAVSDAYLVVMLLALMYFTITGRDERPSLRLVLATILVPVLVVVGLIFTP